MEFAVILDKESIIELNDLLYKELVTDDGVNFKFPYDSGTLRYLDPEFLKNEHDERRLIPLSDEISRVMNRYPKLNNAIKIDESIARSSGWFKNPDIDQ